MLTRFGGENTDGSTAEGEYYLSQSEEAMIKMVTSRFAKTIVILNTPCPIDVRFVEKYNVDALLYICYGGMLGGQALLNILSGKTNPSGKLTDTWALDYYDIPSSMNFYDCAKDGPRLGADIDVWIDTVYKEDIYVGYRYFETFGKAVAYPFGYGLSYSTFEIRTDVTTFDLQQGITTKVNIKNIGSVSGKEVVQLYVGKPEDKLEQPLKELIAFEKTAMLSPGQEQQIILQVPLKHLVSYDENKAAYILTKGEYQLYLGNGNAVTSSERVDSEIIIKQVKNRLQPVQPIKTLSKHDPVGTWPTGGRSGVKNEVHEIEPARKKVAHDPRVETYELGDKIDFVKVLENPELTSAYVMQLNAEQLCRLSVCAKAGWNMAGTGISGTLAVPEGTDICDFSVADGNSGIRVDPRNTGFPATVVFCATFNKQLVYRIGQILGEEAKERGVDLITAPGMNIHRNPLNGRNPEYFSEDPYLTGVMAGYYTAGIEDTGVGAGYKHYLANNCETSRKRNQSIITERAIREIYLRAFELAIEICTPASIMTSYNAVNGIHTAADPELIHGMLREENGFDGCIMTDWNTYDSCDPVEIILGGNNWLTPGAPDDKYTKPLMDAISEGRLPIEVLQESVTYLLRTVAKLYKKSNITKSTN